MARNPDQIVVGASGDVYVAPTATAAPTDPITTLPGAWIKLGLITENGIEQTPSTESNDIMAWQSFYPVRSVVTSRGFTIGFGLLQWSRTTFPFAMGGGTVTTVPEDAGPPVVPAFHKYVPPAPQNRDERSMVVEWQDGTKNYRLVIPRGEVSDLGTSNLVKSDASALPVTFKVLGGDVGDPWYLLTNDPAFAAA